MIGPDMLVMVGSDTGIPVTVCRVEQVLDHLGPVMWTVSGWPDAPVLERISAWNAITSRLFAADCARHVLDIFERVMPIDGRPRRAIEAAREMARAEHPEKVGDLAMQEAMRAASDVYRGHSSPNFGHVVAASYAAIAAAYAAEITWSWGARTIEAVRRAVGHEADAAGIPREEWVRINDQSICVRLCAYLNGRTR